MHITGRQMSIYPQIIYSFWDFDVMTNRKLPKSNSKLLIDQVCHRLFSRDELCRPAGHSDPALIGSTNATEFSYFFFFLFEWEGVQGKSKNKNPAWNEVKSLLNRNVFFYFFFYFWNPFFFFETSCRSIKRKEKHFLIYQFFLNYLLICTRRKIWKVPGRTRFHALMKSTFMSLLFIYQ